MEVGGGDGEYVSLDIEAWEDFLDSRFKRLSVKIDDPVVREAAPKGEKGEGGDGGSASPEGEGTPSGKDEPEEKEGDDGEVLNITPGLEEGKMVESAGGEGGGVLDDVDCGGTVVQSSLEEQRIRDEGAAQVRDDEAPPENLGENSELVPGNSPGGERLVPVDGVSESGDTTEGIGGVPEEGLAVHDGASFEEKVINDAMVSRLQALIFYFYVIMVIVRSLGCWSGNPMEACLVALSDVS